MATTRQNLEAHFRQMIQQCSDKVTELCKLEKETWQTVDELNEKCEAMIKQVDTTTEQQVSHIFSALGHGKAQSCLHNCFCI